MKKTTTVLNTPADPTLPKVGITIAGKQYFLCFDFNVLAKGSELLGGNLLDGLDFDKIDAKRLRTLFWLSLQKFQPEMTEEEAGALGGPFNASKILGAIAAAYTGSNPDAALDGEKSPNAEAPEQS
jgi:hypothetical protein